MRLAAVGICAAGVLMVVAGPASAGRAWTTVGDMSAELRWEGKRAAPASVTLMVSRGEARSTIRSLAGRRWGIAPGMPLAVRDLDRDGTREVLVDLTTGGVRCCQRTVIAGASDGDEGERLTVHDWGAAGYRLTDLNRDGRPEFVSADVRLTGLPGVGARAQRFPVRIWSYRAGEMRDVTRAHRREIRRDMLGHLAEIGTLERRGANPRGAIAAYLADARLLGSGAGAWARMRARDDAPGAERFYAALSGRLDAMNATPATRNDESR